MSIPSPTIAQKKTVNQIGALVFCNKIIPPIKIERNQVSGFRIVDFDPLASDFSNNSLIIFIAIFFYLGEYNIFLIVSNLSIKSIICQICTLLVFTANI